jgi:hypothetical protein
MSHNTVSASRWGFSAAALKDVDGDGWLDAVLAARIDQQPVSNAEAIGRKYLATAPK